MVEVYHVAKGDAIVVVMVYRRAEMKIEYDEKADLLYLRLDPRSKQVLNQRVSDDVVGIEIINASRNLDLAQLLPVRFERVG